MNYGSCLDYTKDDAAPSSLFRISAPSSSNQTFCKNCKAETEGDTFISIPCYHEYCGQCIFVQEGFDLTTEHPCPICRKTATECRILKLVNPMLQIVSCAAFTSSHIYIHFIYSLFSFIEYDKAKDEAKHSRKKEEQV